MLIISKSVFAILKVFFPFINFILPQKVIYVFLLICYEFGFSLNHQILVIAFWRLFLLVHNHTSTIGSSFQHFRVFAITFLAFMFQPNLPFDFPMRLSHLWVRNSLFSMRHFHILTFQAISLFSSEFHRITFSPWLVSHFLFWIQNVLFIELSAFLSTLSISLFFIG